MRRLALVLFFICFAARSDEPMEPLAPSLAPPIAAAPKLTIAQPVASTPAFRMGALLGVSSAGTSLTPTTVTGNRSGLVVGPTFDFHLNDEFFLEVDALSFSSGYTQTVSGQMVSLNYNAIKVPVYLRARLPISDGQVSLHAGAGGSMSIRTSANAAGPAGTVDISTITASSITSVEGLAGVEVKVGQKDSVFLDARYSYGVTNVSLIPNTTAYTRDFFFVIGLRGSF